MSVRVRIAPSNTGPDLHIGNVRTALYNYLFARQDKDGTMILRIEDSDTVRSKDEYADNIAATLDWLGIRIDEGYKKGGNYGPYKQSEKLDHYKKVAEQLIERGHAYYCDCSEEELNNKKKELQAKDPKAFFKYPMTCRGKKDKPKDKKYVIRFMAPTDGEITFDDMVFGKITTPNSSNYDFVMMRADGSVLYNFANVIDDLDNKTTHIIRGVDHKINTPLQILIYQALKATPPIFCHLPMLRNMKNEKLSKRDGATTISKLKEEGYIPGAIINYLARMGWGHKNQEIFTMEDLIEKFSLSSVGRNDAKFDPKKFEMINFEHLKSKDLTSDDQYIAYLLPFLAAKGHKNTDIKRLSAALPLVRPRAKTLVEAADLIIPFISDNIENNIKQSEIPGNFAPHIPELFNNLSSISDANWNDDTLRQSTKNWLEGHNLTLKDAGSWLRLSLTGRLTSPELFQVMQALGRERSIARLAVGVKQAQNA